VEAWGACDGGGGGGGGGRKAAGLREGWPKMGGPDAVAVGAVGV
jgi:hypothetical protein